MAKKAQQLTAILEGQDLLPETQKNILEQFQQFFTTAQEWKEKAESLVVTDSSQVQEMKDARKARLALKELRVEADKTRKRLKEDGLRKNKAIQGIYNVIEHLVKPLEEHLAEQENFVAIQAAQRKAKIAEARRMDAQPFAEFLPINLDWAEMTDEEFKNLLAGAKLQQEEKEAEQLRLKQEAEAERKKAEEKRKALEEENKRLRAEAEARDKAKAEHEAELEAVRKEAADAKAKLEAEEQAKREAREEAEREESARILREAEEAQQAAQAPDKEKLEKFQAEILKLADSMPKMESEKGKAANIAVGMALHDAALEAKEWYIEL